MARLGPAFLAQVYRGLVDDPDFIDVVYVEDGRARGFIAGSCDGPAVSLW